jgi:hypothetical protein
VSVSAPAATVAGVCVTEMVVEVTEAKRMMRPSVAAVVRASPTMFEVPPVQAANVSAIQVGPRSRCGRVEVRVGRRLAGVARVGRDVRPVVRRRAGVGVGEGEDREGQICRARLRVACRLGRVGVEDEQLGGV